MQHDREYSGPLLTTGELKKKKKNAGFKKQQRHVPKAESASRFCQVCFYELCSSLFNHAVIWAAQFHASYVGMRNVSWIVAPRTCLSSHYLLTGRCQMYHINRIAFCRTRSADRSAKKKKQLRVFNDNLMNLVEYEHAVSGCAGNKETQMLRPR